MRNLKVHTKEISEGFAMNAIFDACRANEDRNPKGFVTFRKYSDGLIFANLFNEQGEKIASAIVDEFDV